MLVCTCRVLWIKSAAAVVDQISLNVYINEVVVIAAVPEQTGRDQNEIVADVSGLFAAVVVKVAVVSVGRSVGVSVLMNERMSKVGTS